jgi:hypothetical protein
MIALESAGSAMAVSATVNLRAGGRPLKRRPIPAGFIQASKGRTDEWLRKHFHCGRAVVERWRAELGLPEVRKPRSGPQRPMEMRGPPADLREVAARLHKVALCRHYEVSLRVLNRWLGGLQIIPARPPLKGTAVGLPLPADFHTRAPNMTISEMSRQYKRADSTIANWLARTGITPAAYSRARPGFLNQRGAPIAAPTDGSLASEAAQYLRPRFVVYRYDVRPHRERAHLPNMGKGMWFLASKGAVTSEELVEFARAKGFDPRAWTRL